MNEEVLALILDAIGVCFLVLSLVAAARKVLKRDVKEYVSRSLLANIGVNTAEVPAVMSDPIAEAAGAEAGEKAGKKNALELLIEFIKSAPEWLILGVFGLILIFADKQIASLILGTTSR
jgi:hypothetical protein